MKFLAILIVNEEYKFITMESGNVFYVEQELKKLGEIKVILNEDQMNNLAGELVKNGTINW
jgi:hypothetical protein